jgi:uncharacterized membrane protein
LSHLWQRFLLASSLLVGLAIGVAATVFGYSNLSTVDVHWSVFHLDGVPLWTVVIMPIALILIVGTLFHWVDGLHHFSEHMRHRHRVRELEAEVARLRSHLDHVLEMPRQDGRELRVKDAAKDVETPSLPPADLAAMDTEMAAVEPAAATETPPSEPVKADRKKRPRLVLEPKAAEPAPEHTNGVDAEPAPPAAEA